MFLLYSFLLTVGFLVLLPRFIFQKKYAASFRQRFGKLPDFDAQGKPVIWLHCVSVGETNAARPLVKKLKENFPEHALVISTTTLTGQTLAKKIFANDAALVFYFPFDWKFSARRALDKIKPQIVLLMETEIWFNFVREAGKTGVKVVLVNGRLSEKSAQRYGQIRRTMQRVLHYFDLLLMQNQKDAKRMLGLGTRGTKVRVTGNLKFDQAFDETESSLTKEFRARFAPEKDAPFIIAASTHAPEEFLILEAFQKLKNNPQLKKKPRLILVPRHPERFAEVGNLIAASGFSFVKRTAAPLTSDETAEIVLLDSIGELRAALPLAEIVFVGGSLIPRGGQNILEPATARKAIISGFYTMNFDAAVKEFLAQDALIQLPKLAEKEVAVKLAEVFVELLNDDERREKLAANAFHVVNANRGATEKTVEQLKLLISPK